MIGERIDPENFWDDGSIAFRHYPEEEPSTPLDDALDAVEDEVLRALELYPPFHSAHEGFAILKEEGDELWEEVRGKQGQRNVHAMRAEAIQVAAMAVRFILDVCNEEVEKR